MVRFLVGSAFVAGVLSSGFWYVPGEMEVRVAMLGAVICGGVAAVAMVCVIAISRLAR
jgi:uncharacterized membrane protein (GlpM family)